VTDQRYNGRPSTRRVHLRESLVVIISAVVILLGLAFGRQGDGPDWLPGAVLVLVGAMSIVATHGRRCAREWVVLGAVVIAGLAILVWALS
jgi:hypothetical protein